MEHPEIPPCPICGKQLVLTEQAFEQLGRSELICRFYDCPDRCALAANEADVSTEEAPGR